MQRLCPRCHNVLLTADDGTLVYCGHCGAPQVRLSEEMLEQAAQQATAAAAASLDPNVPADSRPPVERVTEVSAIIWPGAIQCAGLAGAVAAVLTLLSFLLPAVSLLSLLWGFAAPVVVLGLYAARFPRTRIYTGFGARLGLLSGLAIALASMTINSVALVLERFALHGSASIDSQIEQMFVQMRTSLAASPSADEMHAMLRWLTIPEFRAGLVLASLGMMLGLYLAYSSLAGAFAGALRSRRGAQN
jgi:uncharacterized Zn finger protein (UPF0148 family)